MDYWDQPLTFVITPKSGPLQQMSRSAGCQPGANRKFAARLLETSSLVEGRARIDDGCRNRGIEGHRQGL